MFFPTNIHIPHKFCTALCVAISIVSIIACTAAIAGEKLTWENCINKVTKNNPDVSAAKKQVSSSDSLTKAAYSGFLPKLTASFNVTKGNSYSFSQLNNIPLSTPTGDNVTSSGSVSLAQNIFRGFKDSSLVEQTSANRELSRATLDATKVQVSYDLKAAFANLLYSQKYLTLTEQIIKRREENSNLVELHFESGIENKGSVMLSKAFVSQAKYDNVVARNSIDLSRQQLARVMGLDDLENFEIEGDIPLAEPDAKPDFKLIAAQTPLHRQKTASEKASEAGVSLAQSSYYPSLDLTGSVSAQGNNSFPNASRRSFMLNVSLPIFSGGNDYFNEQSASALYASSALQRAATDQQLLPKLKDAYKNYTEAIEKLKVDKAFLEAAEVRAEIGRGKYNNGLLSFEDWDIIENDLITKQKTYLQSEHDRIIAEAAWDLAAGKGVVQ